LTAVRPRAAKRDTASHVIDVAERLCARFGIEAVSIRDIATEAGVSIPVIYHHFGSRSGLLRAIVDTRYAELGEEYAPLLAAAEASPAPTLRYVLRIVLQPMRAWQRHGREVSLHFQALALVCPLPEVKEPLDDGVIGLRRVVALLQRVLPALSHEDLCWRLHCCMKLTHQTASDFERLGILSEGRCRPADADVILERTLAFAEAAFLAPPFIADPSERRPRAARPAGRTKAKR